MAIDHYAIVIPLDAEYGTERAMSIAKSLVSDRGDLHAEVQIHDTENQVVEIAIFNSKGEKVEYAAEAKPDAEQE